MWTVVFHFGTKVIFVFFFSRSIENSIIQNKEFFHFHLFWAKSIQLPNSVVLEVFFIPIYENAQNTISSFCDRKKKLKKRLTEET